jgi:hypothetical protein
MRKIYCYVDESGQETQGRVFLVSVVIVDSNREHLAQILHDIEKKSEKGTGKWTKTKDAHRKAYIEATLNQHAFRGKLFYRQYHSTREYVKLTVSTTASAIQKYVQKEYKATVIVDGLHREERHNFAVSLRKQGIRTEKVRGADEQKDPFVRLADALCGFVRDAEDGRANFRHLLNRAIDEGVIIRL